MYQKTVFYRNIDEVKKNIPKIQEEFRSYADGVIEITVANIPENDIYELKNILKEKFPNFKINGISSGGILSYKGNVFKSLIYLGISGMRESKVLLFGREFRRDSESLVSDAMNYAEELREEIKKLDDVKGIEINFAWIKSSADQFLEIISEGLEDIPVFGTIANANSIENINSYITINNDDAIVINDDFIGPGVSVTVYLGKELYIYTEYLFGWKPVGKYMDVCACDITGEGRTVLYSIDDKKPTDIYYKYLGVEPNKSFVANISEFPLIIERDGIYIGRTPSGYDENGAVYLEGDIRPGEKVRFSYGDYEEILVESRNAAGKMAAFGAESVSLVIH